MSSIPVCTSVAVQKMGSQYLTASSHFSHSSHVADNNPEPCNSCPLFPTASLYPNCPTSVDVLSSSCSDSFYWLGAWGTCFFQLLWVCGAGSGPDGLLGELEPTFSYLGLKMVVPVTYWIGCSL